jgi:hypothetical protein
MAFNFESIRENKIIKKSIRFYPLENDPDVYELAFGDVTLDGSRDVKIKSNNGQNNCQSQ